MHVLASALLAASKHGAKVLGGGACPLEVSWRAGDSVAAASAAGYGRSGAAASRPLTRLTVDSLANAGYDSLTSAGYAVRGRNPPAAGNGNSGHSLTIRIGHKNVEVTTQLTITYGVSVIDLRPGGWYIE